MSSHAAAIAGTRVQIQASLASGWCFHSFPLAVVTNRRQTPGEESQGVLQLTVPSGPAGWTALILHPPATERGLSPALLPAAQATPSTCRNSRP